MSLAAGTRLGSYEIQSAIGAGGMGEVYKALDTRLDRTVAIKVLPPDVSADPERRARFEREAKTIAGLNHPHICVLHDVGAHEGQMFLVMEHLAGQTLAERLEKGPLPLEQVLTVATEIADALAAAHRQGVIHRDLKPGNVMLTKAGAKLLDFGLARLTCVSEGTGASATLSTVGTIAGTVPYMAPEQVQGRPTDARTDIFAFGAVLYEMQTGRRPFEGDSQASVMAAILEHEPPPPSTVRPSTPPLLDQIVRSCLAKNPDARCQCVADARRELAWVAAHLETGGPAAPARRHGSWPTTLLALAALVAAVAGALGVWLTVWNRGVPERIMSVIHVEVPAVFPRGVVGHRSVAVSPDGGSLAYICEQDGRRKICLRSLDAHEATPVPGTEDGSGPFFSPDGRWLGFFTEDDSLKKVRLPSGPAESLVSKVNYQGGAVWGKDNSIIFATDQGKAVLLRVPAAGGPTERVMEAATGEWYLWNPTILPDGRTVLVTASDGSCSGTRIVIQPLDARPRRTLLEGASDARYLATGHLLFVRGEDVVIAPFDATRAALTGPSSPMFEKVQAVPCDSAALSVSDAGTLAYLAPASAGGRTRWSVVWVDRAGKERSSVTASEGVAEGAFAGFAGVRLSPDARRVAMNRGASIFVFDVDRPGVRTRLSPEGTGFWPIWSPDGRRLAFSRVEPRSANANIFWRTADGSAPAERLTAGALTQNPRAFAPGGHLLIFHEGIDTNSGFDIWGLPLNPIGKPYPILKENYHEYAPSLSSDGRWLAYVSEEFGRPEIYVRPFPALDGSWKVSSDGGFGPVWSRNGRELFFQRGRMSGPESSVWSVRVNTSSGFRAEAPRLLFKGPYFNAERYGQSYDVAPDGERFLMVRVEPPPPTTAIQLVFNWFTELKAKVPPAR